MSTEADRGGSDAPLCRTTKQRLSGGPPASRIVKQPREARPESSARFLASGGPRHWGTPHWRDATPGRGRNPLGRGEQVRCLPHGEPRQDDGHENCLPPLRPLRTRPCRSVRWSAASPRRSERSGMSAPVFSKIPFRTDPRLSSGHSISTRSEYLAAAWAPSSICSATSLYICSSNAFCRDDCFSAEIA